MEVLSLMGGEEGISMLKFLGSDDEGYEVEITTKEKKVVFALPEDFINVPQFADEPILQMISGAEKRLRDALPFILQLKGDCVSIGKDEAVIGFTLDQLRKIHKPRRHANTIRAILHELADLGIIKIEKYGRRNVYSLAVDQADVEKRVAGISTVQSIVTLPQSEAEKEIQKQFSTISQQYSREIVIPDFSRNQLSLFQVCSCEVVDTEENQSEAEKQPEDITADKTGEASQPEAWEYASKEDTRTQGEGGQQHGSV